MDKKKYCDVYINGECILFPGDEEKIIDFEISSQVYSVFRAEELLDNSSDIEDPIKEFILGLIKEKKLEEGPYSFYFHVDVFANNNMWGETEVTTGVDTHDYYMALERI